MASTSSSELSKVKKSESKVDANMNTKETTMLQDDESDSCFEFVKRRNLAVGAKPEQSLLKSNAKEISVNKQEVNPVPVKVVNVKPIAQFSPKTSPIKPVTTTSKSSPLKHKIDAIAENLKALQEQKQNQINAPKVIPVVGVKSKKPESDVKKEELLNDKLKNIKLSQKELAHQLILLRCKKIEFKTSLTDEKQKNSKMDEIEINDDLTNLSWLTTFNLSKNMGVTSKYPITLSPPNTPSSPISPLSTYNNSSIDDENQEYDEDESDSNHLTSQSINKNSTLWPFISKLIKPWQSESKKLSPNTHSSTVKVNQIAQRPPYSFSCLTFLAIESSQRKRLSVKEIYAWVTINFPYYRSVPSGSWKNSIRHNLAMNQCFCKVDKNLLAMRDFSGKGSLWCISPEVRPKLVEALEKTRTNEFHHLLQIPYLQDINESIKPVSINTSPTPKVSKNRSTSALNSMPMTIINPRLTQKLTFSSNQQRQPSVTKVGPKIEQIAPTVKASKNESKPNANSDLTELDAVKALLSMKSRASSLPSDESTQKNDDCGKMEQVKSSDCARQGRRKQVFKPPMKKPHINPKLLEKCSNTFYYNDIEDEDEEEIEEEFEDDDDELNNLSQDSEVENSKKSKKLRIKFSSFKKSNRSLNSEHIVTMSDDETDDCEDNKLKIDETNTEQKDDTEKAASKNDVVMSEDSNESNLEPGEIRKVNNKDKNASSNLLLELSRAANLVEDVKLAGNDETSPSKAKRQKISQIEQTTRATRSSNKIETRTVTRSSANKNKAK